MSPTRGSVLLGAVAATWALFLGLGLIMLAHGLQSTLLGVRANIEAFDETITGLIMAGYYVGFLASSWATPLMIKRVGHVRVFAAVASAASVAVLAHSVVVEPVSWTLIRIVTGFCTASLFIVTESWLNDRATNETRAQVLSIYMIVIMVGMAGGQYLLPVSDPGGFELFILVSVLLSVSLVPMLLTASPAPAFEAPQTVSLGFIYRVSPLAVVGGGLLGVAQGAVLGMAAVYAATAGFEGTQVSLFVSAIFLGAVLMQFPIGRLSDRFDRRTVITLTTFAAAGFAGVAWLVGPGHPWTLFALAALFGGTCMSMYALVLSHANDHLQPGQMVAASATLYLVYSAGGILGPLLAGFAMDVTGAGGFFAVIAVLHLAIGAFAVWRMFRRAAPPLDEQHGFVPISQSSASIAVAMAADEYAEVQTQAEAEREEPADGAKPDERDIA
jgi:MFS family permease